MPRLPVFSYFCIAAARFGLDARRIYARTNNDSTRTLVPRARSSRKPPIFQRFGCVPFSLARASLPRKIVDPPDPVSDHRFQTVVHLAISQRFRRNDTGKFVFFFLPLPPPLPRFVSFRPLPFLSYRQIVPRLL